MSPSLLEIVIGWKLNLLQELFGSFPWTLKRDFCVTSGKETRTRTKGKFKRVSEKGDIVLACISFSHTQPPEFLV